MRPVLTTSQRHIFDQVKAFVLERRKLSPSQHAGQPPLTMVNDFPARDRQFITRLAEDLHLSVAWDEYDDEDRNLVTWRFPGELEEPLPENGKTGEDDAEAEDEEWEDDDDEESRAAVDRVLNKYEKAKVMEDDKEGDFDSRYELSVKEKMDEWKRGYYKVSSSYGLLDLLSAYTFRRGSSRSHTTIRRTWATSSTDTLRVSSGSCTTTIAVSLLGVGSTITTTLRASQVRGTRPRRVHVH